MKNYKDLKVWQKSFELSWSVYELTKNFPEEEKFSLTSQIRRSAISIPSNIAEGSGRYSDKEFIKFLYIAKGSANELETQVLIAEKAKYLTSQKSKALQNSLSEILKMLSALIKSIS